ncbi:ATP-dependent DNA helicase DinG [Desemzia sp. RIT804]|uniref:ATP-dependent DNA helicase DinG n=1 Tax=Desemzia sp. RIT 804 TaxID=2810209 RepID=UPI0019528635|nr:ATP-dependent DNA helicase DinG [Desemzia sp. RIT 804]MBM6613732.1 ATP-dependent DNA helicase DinG [Desemzia sp. RIT 804]
MDEMTTYAVVDIETTGGNVQSGDRIIQFGCTLIENDQIVHQFATDVNPLRSIPKEIEHLTGISNQSIAHAPYFEDVATTIYNLLDGCIFVAHNIQFDYQFLSEEFVRCGLPPLTLKGIDTVELAQILLPTEPSFTLNDLMNSQNIVHKNPHQADSDAYATAELFLLLKQRLKSLPLVTVEKLASIAPNCTMDTEIFIYSILKEMKQHVADLPENLMIKKGLAIRHKDIPFEQDTYREAKDYPKGQQEKADLFLPQFELRGTQIEMMDAVQQAFASGHKEHLIIEAPTGIGKTFGYLVPAVYNASSVDPIVISTYTTLLQQQLFHKDLVQLQEMIPFRIQAAILKSKSHYIHLSKFESLLKEPVTQKLEAIYQMRILVWLTQTETGDLDELNLTNYNQPFWNKIRHRGWLGNETEDEWYEEDFFLHAQKVVQHAGIIVTNHAYLCHDLQKEDKILKDFQRLIVDEAHHLSEVAQQSTSQIFRYYYQQKLFKWLGKKEDKNSLIGRLMELADKPTASITHQLENIEMSVYFLMESLSSFIDELLQFCWEQIPQDDYKDRYDILYDREEHAVRFKRTTKKILSLMNEVSYLGFEVVDALFKEKERFTQIELHLITDFYDCLTDLKKQQDIFAAVFHQSNEQEVTWFSFAEKTPKNSFTAQQSYVSNHHFLKEQLVNKVSTIIYTGATLEVDGSFDYFQKQIGETNVDTLKLDSPYNYEKQVKFWVPKGVKPVKSMTKKRYAQMIVEYLSTICKNSDENVLVLFTAFEPLHDVYEQLQRKPEFFGREILAQGLSGSRERILKRFFRSQGGILLGADSFWEGVDLPGKALSILVVTRLPFESPERPYVKAKHYWMKKNHLNPFYVDTLPKATLRLKQGLGRLVRSQSDKGVFIVLDERLLYSNFGKLMQRSLPKGIMIEEMAEEEMEVELRKFLTDET